MKEEELVVKIIQICNKKGEVLITKIDPAYSDDYELLEEYILTCGEVIERFENILTDEEKEKLKSYRQYDTI